MLAAKKHASAATDQRPENGLSDRDSPAGDQSINPGGGHTTHNGTDDWNGLIWDNLKLSAKIPREIRDEIYSYLALSPESTKYTPTTDQPPKLGEIVDGRVRGPHSHGYCHSYGLGITTAHTYSFNIAMLLVNKPTRADVEQYIIKTNKFVLVEYYVPLMSTMLSHCAVPVVADQHLGPCKVHSVRIRFEWRDPPGIRVAHLQERPRTECGRLLLTWDDFPKLCRMLKFMYQYSDPAAVYIMSERNNHLWTTTGGYDRDEAPALYFIIVRQLSSTKQMELVKNILTIVGGGYRLGLFGVPDDRGSFIFSQMRSILMSTGPDLIWAKAVLWNRVQTALELKREADSLAESGQLRAAQRRFFWLMEYFTYESELDLLDYFTLPHEETQSDDGRETLKRCWYGLRTDLCFSIAAIHVFMTQNLTLLVVASPARECLQWLESNKERSFDISDHEFAQRVHMRAIVHLACFRGMALSELLMSIPIREFIENVQNYPEHSTSRSRADYDTLCGLQQKLQQVI